MKWQRAAEYAHECKAVKLMRLEDLFVAE